YPPLSLYLSFSNHPPPTELYTLSLHNALPISVNQSIDTETEQAFIPQTLRNVAVSNSLCQTVGDFGNPGPCFADDHRITDGDVRSEEHTSELQSRGHLVCRLLLEKKKK